MSRPGDDYRPLKIMHIDVWEILYSKLVGGSIGKTGRKKYSGSVPMSLDMMKINSICKSISILKQI
ncbi:hypothetical protein SAMN02910456_01593 [Ruminococcaceae bacterium YRB3002]|nr:hypothetical protein SAMN02910456_01593 [Ruminococcaceae bacterium YRB3002]